MDKAKAKQIRRDRRRAGARKRIRGTIEMPRLCVYRSLQHMYVQVIDDLNGQTLAAASTCEGSIEKTGNAEAAAVVGKAIAEKAKTAGVSRVVFDRNGFRYHGRVRALAEAAREGGLQF